PRLSLRSFGLRRRTNGTALRLPPYVHAFTDRHGKARFYFRRRGFKQTALSGLPYSTEFMDAYQVALDASPSLRTEIGASRTNPGTIDALVASYYKSDAWVNRLEEETRKTRRRIIEKFRAEHGNKRVALLRQEHIIKMLGEIARPSVKRNWLKAIRGVMQAAIPTMRKVLPASSFLRAEGITLGPTPRSS